MAATILEPDEHRIDSTSTINALRQTGHRTADLHLHSSCSYDVLPVAPFAPEAIFRKARERGLDFVSITDHDSMDAYDRIGWEREGLVTGVEISIRDLRRIGHTVHINVFDLDRRQFFELEHIAKKDQNIEQFVALLRQERLPCVYNHPLWAEPEEALQLSSVEQLAQELPVLEINAKRIRELNLIAMRLSQRHGLGLLAAGDSHIGDMGNCLTLARGDSFRDWFENVTRGHATLVARHLDRASLNAEIATWRELMFDGNAPLADTANITGNRAIDSLMRFFANRAQDRRLLLVMPALQGLLREITESGVPSALYVYSQTRDARRYARADATLAS